MTFLFGLHSLGIKERFTQRETLQFVLTMSEIIPNKPAVLPGWSRPKPADSVSRQPCSPDFGPAVDRFLCLNLISVFDSASLKTLRTFVFVYAILESMLAS